ncbi:MAG: TIGR00730 family Rossman fold protein [Candidatus Microthrix sp.]|nr:TIGR00730 family Rossman fold protein [Candidatus Microthrix sp.]MBP7879752.1 TIGR00730 family Rossman fold protein [Candidatus Microthrix sp.]MBP7996274.1 TIGR00730 family Rossman fold protein [Candidatus Microthrix sp.]MBP9622617.1 TIGR00730 family Rossman fold protein [Candidatus Microthrix sp.]MBP9835971.1 TIGR00730 family Rossman fold protein [Candidatus Microthrix sp.]
MRVTESAHGSRRSETFACSAGRDPAFRTAAVALGSAIVDAGHRLVFGGGHVGLMGVVADEVLARDGEIIGVMTEQLVGLEVAHQGLTELDVQPTMHRRKARMAELADGVVVLTGGFGTLDEAFELLTWNQLGLISVPIVFLDVDGFFAPLFDFNAGSAAAGFMKDHHGTLAQHTDNAEAAVRLASRNAPAFTPKWVDR